MLQPRKPSNGVAPQKRSLDTVFTPPSIKTSAHRAHSGRLLACTKEAAGAYRNRLTGQLGTTQLHAPLKSTASKADTRRLQQCENNIFGVLGLPPDVEAVYRQERNVTCLYDWQRECLSDQRLLQGSNFVLSLPTGAGKTLVAELLMLREVLNLRKSCILILPFVAIVQEKTLSFAPFEQKLKCVVEEYANVRGRIPPFKRFLPSLYLCTIEKANVLVNSLVEENRLDELGLVICDELHMLGEGRRGCTLEQCLTKVMVTNARTQVIGMSATLSSIAKVQNFLNAYLYTTDFRPVILREYVKVGDDVLSYDTQNNSYKGVRKVKRLLPPNIDADGVVPLIADVIPTKSVLVFCPTRVNTENLTLMLSKNIPKAIRERNAEEKAEIVRQLIDSNEGAICPTMRAGVLAGVAYHHSGLTREERILIESAFKKGIIYVVCATSTLAAGVNLPARRVIIRSPRVGREILGKVQYLQMVGRAGRAGLDTEGESYIVLQPGHEYTEFQRMRAEPLPPCKSYMAEEQNLEAFILDLITLDICKSEAELQAAMRKSMLDLNNAQIFDSISNVLQKLVDRKMIDENHKITNYGRAASKGNIRPEVAISVFDGLLLALDKGIILSSHFHLLCVIVPNDIELYSVDFNVFYDQYKQLKPSEKELLATWDIQESDIVRAFAAPPRIEPGVRMQRVWIAFMLRELWSPDATLAAVASKYSVTRGWLNATVQAACTYANQLTRFVDNLSQLWAFKLLLPELLSRLHMGTRGEIAPLLELDCVKKSRAEQLVACGWKTVGAVSRLSVDELVKALFVNREQANRIIISAAAKHRDMLANKAEELRKEGAVEAEVRAALADEIAPPPAKVAPPLLPRDADDDAPPPLPQQSLAAFSQSPSIDSGFSKSPPGVQNLSIADAPSPT